MRKSLIAKEQIYNYIKHQRQTGEFRLKPERALAGELGFSRATIVKVLNEFESEGLIARKPGSGTFIQPEIGAIAKKPAIAVVMRSVYYRSDEHFRLIVDTVSEYAGERGLSIQIFDNQIDMFEANPDDNPLLNAIKAKQINGVLITSRLPLAIMHRLSTLCPVVAINNTFGDGSEICCISCDYFRVGFLAGKFLLEQGHRHIAYLTDELNHPESVVELSGFQAALEMGGVTFNSDNILETRLNAQVVCDRVEKFFRNAPYTGCFIRRIDRLATLALAWEKIGFDWHEKMQIIGGGNYRHIDRRNWNVNIIDNRLEDMCRMGLDTLAEKFTGGDDSGFCLKLLTPSMLELNNRTLNKKAVL